MLEGYFILRTQKLRGKYLESIRRIKTVPVERRYTSREHSMAIDLRDLLEELAEMSELLEIESWV